MMYAGGRGVAQSYPEAAKWWAKAGESGHLLAAENAVNLYTNGEGGIRDKALVERLTKILAGH
jgi:TPR repeat protein